jgi:hypothetical protein
MSPVSGLVDDESTSAGSSPSVAKRRLRRILVPGPASDEVRHNLHNVRMFLLLAMFVVVALMSLMRRRAANYVGLAP